MDGGIGKGRGFESVGEVVESFEFEGARGSILRVLAKREQVSEQLASFVVRWLK